MTTTDTRKPETTLPEATRRDLPSDIDRRVLFQCGLQRTHRNVEVASCGPGTPVVVAGRINELKQKATDSIEMRLSDGSGPLTVVVTHDSGEIRTNAFERGDIVFVKGQVEEISGQHAVRGTAIYFCTKSQFTLPSIEAWESLPKQSTRPYRDVDLLLGTDLGQILRLRPQFFRQTRIFLDEQGFVEVDTPYLVPYPDIAPAQPVRVASGKYAVEGDLRIANTEFMRRLLVGGFEKIYQLGRCFRDERTTFKHALEFTQLTFGIAYTDYIALLELVEALVRYLVKALQRSNLVHLNGRTADLAGPWRRVTVRDAIMAGTGIDINEITNVTTLKHAIAERKLNIDETTEYGGTLAHARMLDQLIDLAVVPNLIEPTFLTEYPFVLGGPAKAIESRPGYKMRSELFICGVEIANVSTPQNDPADVRAWYNDMLELKRASGWTDIYLDDPYLSAMDIGIPISATGAVGFDRLFMLLAGLNEISDAHFFPSGKLPR